MIKYLDTGASLSLVLGGKPYTLARDNPLYETVRNALGHTGLPESWFLNLINFHDEVVRQGQGRVTIRHDRLMVDDEAVPAEWIDRCRIDMRANLPILMARIGDQVRIEGDEEVPDGVHTISGVDRDDCDNTLYIETDTFFGYVPNTSVQEVIPAQEPPS